MKKNSLSFEDVLIQPRFSTIRSRKDVDLSQNFLDVNLGLPIISSNMDTITEDAMANAMRTYGAIGCLHRFMTIQENVDVFSKCHPDTIVSIGLGKLELERAEALKHAGAKIFCVDVAHGASIEVCNQVDELNSILSSNNKLIVGNFANANSIVGFKYHLRGSTFDAVKVGIGGGSACTTRVVTGCGSPTLSSIFDCATVGLPIIADGGIRNVGDIAKALGAGASAVMLGGMLSGTTETPGEVIYQECEDDGKGCPVKKYRGSASLESYVDQGKVANHRAPEGESMLVPIKGTVVDILQNIEGGLRSSFSYVGASNHVEFKEFCTFEGITPAGVVEGKPHGKQNT